MPTRWALSPLLLWSLVVDELLNILSGQGFEVQGYADGAVILIIISIIMTLVSACCRRTALNLLTKVQRSVCLGIASAMSPTVLLIKRDTRMATYNNLGEEWANETPSFEENVLVFNR